MSNDNKETREQMCSLPENPPQDVSDELRAFMAKMPKYSSADSLTCFFYLLMRDHLPAGTVTRLVADCMDMDGEGSVFTNGHLAQFAALCSDELKQAMLIPRE